MGQKVVLCFVLVFLQSGIESRLEVGGRGEEEEEAVGGTWDIVCGPTQTVRPVRRLRPVSLVPCTDAQETAATFSWSQGRGRGLSTPRPFGIFATTHTANTRVRLWHPLQTRSRSDPSPSNN
jgi:hypothetical protein